MRSCVIAAALLTVGCFNPKYGNQSFYCHEDDSPACPDGQYCVNGQCQNTPGGGGSIILDGGTSSNLDLSSSGGGGLHPLDLSMGGGGGGGGGGQPDLSMPGGSTLNGCHGLIQCLVACTTMSCETTCQGNATSQANTLEQAAIGCGQDWCTTYTGECVNNGSGTLQDGFEKGSCNNCLNDALANLTGSQCTYSIDPSDCNTSHCTSQVQMCVSDTP
jgi:hypothetical protein